MGRQRPNGEKPDLTLQNINSASEENLEHAALNACVRTFCAPSNSFESGTKLRFEKRAPVTRIVNDAGNGVI
jgi:hypothetical protein